ncbi:hypothetical protein BDV36DRAFT_302269 [Aspergillus pseudocaelatus]|uniref:Uncharacterized protein n=1 Tax=Aspergillus pseudocaelatus TaxID=1825620 RepID=A0ABQ6W1D2_9EURO|nr:hypothetical protein BDV36DRAFT_302269 [Aspergillus pseudocaelatus]
MAGLQVTQVSYLAVESKQPGEYSVTELVQPSYQFDEKVLDYLDLEDESVAAERKYCITASFLKIFEAEFCVDLPTLETSVTLKAFNKILGTFTGNLKDGIKITTKIPLLLNGWVRFFSKGKEVWVEYDIKIVGKNYTGKQRLFTLP